ncbi:MAG: globin domain-containing protein [Polyangiales bacterium]|nr:nitric oxide dioxygenase [Sandaracinaceae bacterium]
MLTDEQKALITENWRLAVPIADTIADLFYRRLFQLRPEYKALFGEDMASQKQKLLQMLAFVVRSLQWGGASWSDDVPPDDDLFLVLLALGRRHSNLYEIPDEAYEPVLDSLLWTLDYGLGKAFNEDASVAWTQAMLLISNTMILGRYSVDEAKRIRTSQIGNA